MDSEHLASLIDRANHHGLASKLLARCWPGGPHDRTEPAAREWLRRWTPRKLPLQPPACSCAVGRCTACN